MVSSHQKTTLDSQEDDKRIKVASVFEDITPSSNQGTQVYRRSNPDTTEYQKLKSHMLSHYVSLQED